MGAKKTTTTEDWPATRRWLSDMSKFPSDELLNEYGQMGVRALYEATPRRTGKTAASWSYDIVRKGKSVTLYWTNSNLVWEGNEKVSVAVLIQNGHATVRGNWVEGRDFINPALEPVLKKLHKALDKEAQGR